MMQINFSVHVSIDTDIVYFILVLSYLRASA